jgi:hypothetical protein
MADTVENIVLEQLRPIRADIRKLEATLTERIDAQTRKIEVLADQVETVDAKIDGNTGIMYSFGKYLRDIDRRVEHIEEKLGIDG